MNIRPRQLDIEPLLPNPRIKNQNLHAVRSIQIRLPRVLPINQPAPEPQNLTPTRNRRRDFPRRRGEITRDVGVEVTRPSSVNHSTIPERSITLRDSLPRGHSSVAAISREGFIGGVEGFEARFAEDGFAVRAVAILLGPEVGDVGRELDV